jgi:hypothetical protein
MAGDLLVAAGVTAEDIQQYTRVLEGLASIVSLDEADHLDCQFAFIFESSDLKTRIVSFKVNVARGRK